MLKIGDFSKVSKVTIKALRYYEKEGLLKPNYIDNSNNYRYYDSNQLIRLARIISLKQVGLSIEDIKSYLNACLKQPSLLSQKAVSPFTESELGL